MVDFLSGLGSIFSWKNFKNKLLSLVKSNTNLSESEKVEFEKHLNYLEKREVNILLIGGTGVGKSSTINALFQTEGLIERSQSAAKVGYGPNPETQNIDRYALGNLIIWDTPGIGESPTADVIHKRAIVKKIREVTNENELLIDLVLVILDGGIRDYGTTFELLKLISPHIEDKSRVIVGINKIDHIKNGRGWDEKLNQPTPKLQEVIDEKVQSVKRRLKDSIGFNLDPIPYCAGSIDDFDPREPYQISELLTQIIVAIPEQKRIALMNKVKEEAFKQTNTKQRETIRKKTRESMDNSGIGKTILRVGLGILTGGLLGGCFITTAVCRYKGKKDNCFILNQFRNYRDKWLTKQPGGTSLVHEYYQVAPGLVQWIDFQPDKEAIYEMIYTKYLRRCSRLIKKREYALCKEVYIKMVEHLKALSSNN